MFADLDRLADRGQLKVLRTLGSVRECGRQLNNCLAEYKLAQCRRLPCPRNFFFSPLEFYSLFLFIFRPTP